MEQEHQHSLMNASKNLLTYCHELKLLLKHDEQAFIQNEHDTLQDSNQKKNIFLQKITHVMSEIQNLLGDTSNISLFTKIKQASLEFTQSIKDEWQAIEAELGALISHCYQQIIINKNLTNASIIRLQTLNSQLLACKEDMGCVYDSKGHRIK